ncbi:thiol:disulfide interchange protein [Altericroceibacterium spongiae]|uniref:Thiol:disulfide interchange protein n=1 Tax=Altericroceibacterium spongiae TaxID=2320269 RepID=A0A420EBY5_9SPHN|nr:protein-disulfide reductase DsbD domain-containing protein [Altericroceibacterium spongiae]RKF18209.1 thiol:disulfide interchange protein [Altericroceibacterium spongiae]
MRARILAILRIVVLALLGSFLALGALPAQANDNNISAELVAEAPAQPGSTVWLALHFRPGPGWHGYWSNPGDAGFGMELAWHLPDGWHAGTPLYPLPQQLVISGLMNHVYEGDYAVLVPVDVPPGAQTGHSVPVNVDANWLACTDKICVPERATLTQNIAVSDRASDDSDPRFDGWRAALPPPLDRQADFALTPDALRLAIPLPATMALTRPHVFVGQPQLVDYTGAQIFRRKGDTLLVDIPREGLAKSADAITGILKLDDGGNAIRFTAAPGDVPKGGTLVASGDQSARPLAPLWVLLAGALAGGLLLNIMPCVFPILSLKAMSLARAGESEADARREGLAYTLGVVLACVALGALLLGLRAGGSQIGWAFQLQEPGVVLALLVLACAITANLAGLFELPSFSFTRSGGRSSAFATGLLAAFVATPCTGPFMAAAMGAALLLPWWQALLLFAALGLGLGLPFLMLGFVPPLRRLLPRPGRWMETFRKILAIPMGLTALALAWLAWRLGGPLFLGWGLVLAGGLILAFWAWNRGRRKTHIAAMAFFVLLIVLVPFVPRQQAAMEESLLDARSFSPEALAEARREGPVFLWFTADWCLTCKVNENVAIEREATRAAFARQGVIAMRGDWTQRDPVITRFLTEHGAAGVPLYLWYPAGEEAQQLPQMLTPDSLIDLAEAEAKTP